MRIGKNLIRFRNELNISQEEFANKVGKHQSTISRIESDLQDASWKDIEAFAAALGKTTDEMAQRDGIVLNIENQHGGSANNYVVQNGSAAALAAKDQIISAKDQTIEALQALLKMEKERSAEKDAQIQALQAHTRL